jgi:pectate lyase
MIGMNTECWQRFAWRLFAAVIGCVYSLAGTAAVGMPIGFATLNGGTTGGGNGPTVTATTAVEFQNFVEQSGPLNIEVAGTLNVGNVEIESDKTIVGIGSTGGLVGNIKIDGVSNVIIQNLSISNPSGGGTGDTIEVSESTNVWIDHNDIFNSTDGLLDIVRESDFVTVSWNKFFYTPDFAQNVNTGHRFAMLIGNGDGAVQDADNLRVTLHHNHWGENVRERMPRVRFGDVHVFNDYFNTPGNNYAIRAAIGSELLVENNSFENVNNPFEKFFTTGANPLIEASGNLFVNSGGTTDAGDNVFNPPYAYTLDSAQNVKDLVLGGAGVGFTPVLAGDYNENGVVDAADYTVWRDRLGQPAGSLPNDVDGGIIGMDQYTTWKTNFGNTGSGSSAAKNLVSVPEPAALLLLAAGIGLLLRVRRRAASVCPCPLPPVP